MNKDSHWIQSLKSGNKKALDEIYLKYKKPFIDFSNRYQIPHEDALDIFQDSIIVLYENILKGKLSDLSSSLKTYLFAVGKYKILSYIKSKNAFSSIEISEIEILDKIDIIEIETQDLRLKHLHDTFSKLGIKCQEILKLFYYQGLGLDEIQELMGYDSKDTAKSQKSRCLKQLKELMKNYG
ncbi:RNA polymerase sigma-70 factor, ECF subfamily, putative [Indibacter alkaliphilus LW1]|uniref:RNA polymerase sigma-70 factor, ECF subfamily, putative n=1 Tax=Indibacter alkaliphilus (strain CCUG 57479 / KCTC 22604 / LW1) TaxID=1189612 RepID=S2DHR0_INDAL|nr:sigma-70 family RNA polymerase sigma factor [Indibacter alkaliphilus]EOZ91576.1 RNA polymerase sigma-70 factor, ECF subfamily, putative [Indibacter alkaliphilus LW1]